MTKKYCQTCMKFKEDVVKTFTDKGDRVYNRCLACIELARKGGAISVIKTLTSEEIISEIQGFLSEEKRVTEIYEFLRSKGVKDTIRIRNLLLCHKDKFANRGYIWRKL